MSGRSDREDAPPWAGDEATELALASLDLALPPMTPPPGLLARVEAAVAAVAPPAIVVQALATGRWRTVAPGVRMKRVWEHAFLLQCDPGAVAPDHEHPTFEHAIVVSGDLVTEMGTFGPGDYHGVPAGARHQPWTSRTGCVVLVQYAA
jgi:anti-sigma factor ChrR (cupin superfamily)